MVFYAKKNYSSMHPLMFHTRAAFEKFLRGLKDAEHWFFWFSWKEWVLSLLLEARKK